MDLLQSEIVVVVAFLVLIGVVVALSWLLTRVLDGVVPRLHEGMSDSMAAKLFVMASPELARLAGTGLDVLDDALTDRAGQTTNTIDDQLVDVLGKVMAPLQMRLDEIERRQMLADGRLPDGTSFDDYDTRRLAPLPDGPPAQPDSDGETDAGTTASD